MTTKIALALGGGGSRGYAHIGVLRRLEKEGYSISAIAGTSAGGIISSLYAAGYSPNDMEDALCKMDQSRLFGHAHRDEPSLLGFDRARQVLTGFLGDKQFHQLNIPCAVVAVDIDTGKEVILDKGNVVDAVLATGAVPAVFPPQKIGEHKLIDGATLNPVPVSVARMLAPRKPIIAVVLSSPVGKQHQLGNFKLPVKIPGPIISRINNLRLAQALNMYLLATEVGSRMLTELRLTLDNPELIIYPEVGNYGFLDKVDVRQIVQLGDDAMTAALPELRRVTSWGYRVQKKYGKTRRNEARR